MPRLPAAWQVQGLWRDGCGKETNDTPGASGLYWLSPLAARNSVRAHAGIFVCPLPAASLTERVEPWQTAIALPARHTGPAGTGALLVTLQVQGAWGRQGTGREWCVCGRGCVWRQGWHGAKGPAHLLGGSRRAGIVPVGPSGRSCPGSVRSGAQPCGHGSGDSAHRGRCCGKAPGRKCSPQSGRCSCRLWAGGGAGVKGASLCWTSRQLGEGLGHGLRWNSGPA